MLESLCIFPTLSVALVIDITILFPSQTMPGFFFTFFAVENVQRAGDGLKGG